MFRRGYDPRRSWISWRRGIEEVIPVLDGLDLVQRRVPRPDHRHWTRGDARAVECGQVTCITERLKLGDHDGPSRWTIGLEVHEQEERGARRSVINAVLGCFADELRGWIFAMQGIQDRLDVQTVERSRRSEGGLFVPDV